MRNARVLILDDEESWIKVFRKVLDGKVMAVASAQTLAEALEALDERYFNVAIVDLRLDDRDESDESGLEFLRALAARGLDGVVAPIVCTAFGNMKRAVQALRDYKVVDFIAKGEFEPAGLLAAVAAAAERGQCAEPIEIEIEGGQPIATLWRGMEWAGREDPAELEAELRDLLCRLFPKATGVWIGARPAGQSGAGILRVEPTYGANAGEMDIVKFGKRETIVPEIRNYGESVEVYASSLSSTQVDSVTGRIMGAIRYRLIGAGRKVDSLAERYIHYGVEDVCGVLDNLFGVTCCRWYDNREQPRRQRDLVALYTEGLHIRDWQEVWAAAARAGIDTSGQTLAFPGLPGRFVNPRHWWEVRRGVYSYRAWVAITHGDLNEHNVLVTDDGRCWLIDFYRTGKGHILRDFVELETAFKFSLTPLDDDVERLAFEQALIDQGDLREPIACEPHAAYADAAAVVGHLRDLAGEVLGLERSMEEYQAALLLQTLKYLTLKALDGDPGMRRQVLLSAALLCTHLGLPREA